MTLATSLRSASRGLRLASQLYFKIEAKAARCSPEAGTDISTYDSSVRTILLCLHGWGGSKASFTELRVALRESEIEVLTPDLPGFGNESEPDRPWNVDDYANWVERWFQKNGRWEMGDGKLLLLGHSHGGRIAMKLAARGTLPIAHLTLCAPAGIRRPRHFRRILGLTLAKSGKLFLSLPGVSVFRPLARKLLYKLIRVHDYEQASPVMRETMISVTREDLRLILSQITTPTDIFWGEDDRMTPIADARVIHAGIRGSHLHTYPGVRHNVHRERAQEIADVIRQGSV